MRIVWHDIGALIGLSFIVPKHHGNQVQMWYVHSTTDSAMLEHLKSPQHQQMPLRGQSRLQCSFASLLHKPCGKWQQQRRQQKRRAQYLDGIVIIYSSCVPNHERKARFRYARSAPMGERVKTKASEEEVVVAVVVLAKKRNKGRKVPLIQAIQAIWTNPRIPQAILLLLLFHSLSTLQLG